MYLSSDEARSDLFLSAAVFVIGPLILGFIVQVTQVGRLPGAGEILIVLIAIATTVLVPYLLIRYRKQRLSEFGFGGDRGKPLVDGLLAAAPVVVAGFVALTVARGDPLAASPILDAAVRAPAGDGDIGFAWFTLVVRFINVVGRTLLAVYCTVLAREAFRGDPD